MSYIHGESTEEQGRLKKLNVITNEDFLAFLGDLSEKKVCEVGSGLGVLTNEIATKYSDVSITGMEICHANYEVSLQNNKDNANVVLMEGDFLENRFEDQSFDITFCRYVLEHVSNPQKVVDEMVRITKKGGMIICQENDLHNGLIYPPVDNYHELRQLFARLQQDLGCDPYVGRKLYSYFCDKGLTKVDFSMKSEIHTQEDPQFPMWIFNLRELLNGVKEEFISRYQIEESLFEQVYHDLTDRIEHPKGTYLFQWNRIKVIK